MAIVHTQEELMGLLAEAEKKLQESLNENKNLAQDNEHLNTAINDMMSAQMEEAEQMVQLTEQCWQLERALEEALSEKNAVLQIVQGLNSGLNELKEKADSAIEKARKETSRVQLVTQLMDLASVAKNNPLDEQLAKFSEPIMPHKS